MDTGALANLADPAIIFFFLGIVVAAVRSNLEIPAPIVKFFSLYLLMAIGFKGGRAMQETGFDGELVRVLLAAVLLAFLVPALAFLFLRRRVDVFDAAAIAATYGSVSAVTFIAATAFLVRQEIEFSGAMTVALVIMESPAIIMAVLLATWARSRQPASPLEVHEPVPAPAGAPAELPGGSATLLDPQAPAPTADAVPVGGAHASGGIKGILHEAFTDGAHLLLIGSMVVGVVSTDDGAAAMAPFTEGLFKGVLAFFLLEMGLVVSRELRQMRNVGRFLVGFGLTMPIVGASIAIAIGNLIGLAPGNAVLLAVLAGSASYIVVPAVVRYAIPEARPSRYFGLALGVTFPFNIIVGIPLYHAAVTWLW